MNIEEIKTKLEEMVPSFAAKVQPVYQLLQWEWSPGKQEPHVPSVGEIENTLYHLVERLREGCEGDISIGGLSAYYRMPDENEPGCYGITFELEEEVAF
ncbi:unnamed protein product [marine sediment metagenome]|uniref:Uncharacterized protein n=1 Tax=marine sediment metagenome TaxID=412755 RepID=X1HH16_9ZZZZ